MQCDRCYSKSVADDLPLCEDCAFDAFVKFCEKNIGEGRLFSRRERRLLRERNHLSRIVQCLRDGGCGSLPC